MAGSHKLSSRAGRRGALALAGSFLGAVAIIPANAQYGPPPWAYPYYHEYRGGYPSPPGAPGDEGPMPGADYPGSDSGYEAPRSFTAADVRRRVARLGLHLVAKPRRKDNIYLAEAEDPNGVAHRLVFDAEGGRLIENTKLPSRKTPAHRSPEVGQ